MSYSSSTVVTEEGGRQNMYAHEPIPYQDENYSGYVKEAELANGRWAMIGLVAGIGAYAVTGQMLPGIF